MQQSFSSKLSSTQKCMKSLLNFDVFKNDRGRFLLFILFIQYLTLYVISCWHTRIYQWGMFLVFLLALLPGCLSKSHMAWEKLLKSGFRVLVFPHRVLTLTVTYACMLSTSATHFTEFYSNLSWFIHT